MNSSYGKSNSKTGSGNAFDFDFDFDFGLGSSRPTSLNDRKKPTSSNSSTPYIYSSGPQKPNASSSWAQQSNKPAWTHQPAPLVQSGMAGSLSGQTTMVGDIFGKSWNSSAPSNPVGIVDSKNPNLFGDLLGSAMGQNKSSSNLPLKNAATAANQKLFSMGNVADSLPKTGFSGRSGGSWGSNVSSVGGNANPSGTYKANIGLGGANLSSGVKSNNSNPTPGGRTAGNGVGGAEIGSKKDPFGSLVDFGSEPLTGINKSRSKESEKSVFGADSFGEFQNATSKISGSSSSSGAFAVNSPDPLGGFGFSSVPSGNQSQPSKQPSGANDFDLLFSSTTGGGAIGSEGYKSQQLSDYDDWDSEFAGGNDTGGTTEIEGLPPPPAGVSAPSAKNKGMDNYKQGQFADAIKWLSWAVILLEKAGDVNGAMEVLTSRASCYKEVGEYKKAVADCTKMLEHDGKNVSALVQRALLYESMEKYKLGAEDLSTAMKLDPGNRVARSTIHRLRQMAG